MNQTLLSHPSSFILPPFFVEPQDVIAAFKAILSACKSNLQSVSTVIKAREHEELATRMVEIERRLGIGEGSGGRGDPAIGGSAD